MSKATYVLYQGDEVIDIGTAEELTERRDVKPSTIYYYSMQAYRKRIKGQDNRLLAVRVDDDQQQHDPNTPRMSACDGYEG